MTGAPQNKALNKSKQRAVEESSDSDEDFEFLEEEGGLKVDGIYIPPPPPPYFALKDKGPRLIITRIVNSFFKSYAHGIVVGPFHKCFNCIVGPNGSGKSNVIDSMLFVFGYRASKIRSKKLSVLIHNSESFRNVHSCTVSVHFALIVDKAGDEYDLVPNSEFVVSRTANKDNSSYFTVNNQKTQFKDVAVLLKKHGIDLTHNRFLILQGEVEQIAMMQPKGNGTDYGMLEYLEDIIGTGRYKVPIVKLERRVEQLSHLRTDKLNRMRLVQDEIDVLKEPMEEALKYLKLENSIMQSKSIVYQYNIFVLRSELSEIDEEYKSVDQELGKINENLSKASKEIEEKKGEIKEATKKYGQLEKRKETMKEAYKSANNKDIQLAAEMKESNNNRHKNKDLLAAEKKKLEKFKVAPEEVQKEIQDYEAKLEKLEPQRAKIQEEKVQFLESIKELTKDLQTKKEVLQSELAELQGVVNEAKANYTLADTELKTYVSSQNSEAQKIEETQTKLNNISIKIEQYTNELKKLSQEIPNKDKDYKKVVAELPELKNKEVSLITELRRKVGKLEECRAATHASKSRGKVLDALLQEKRKGNCAGLFGRLGDLGAIDPKYDVAVSTACGPLDHLIVDTVTTGQWCIEHLKKNNIGRTSIIALEKQEHLIDHCQRPIQTPENVPRLFDLIQVADEKFKPAFYYGLRDTLVAEDLEQASRIAYGSRRYRVVTLQGDLIELTGTMSGGGNRVSRGRMGKSLAAFDVDPMEISRMEVEVKEEEVVLQQLRSKQQSFQNHIATLMPEINEMKIAQKKMSMEMESLEQQKEKLTAQLKELNKNMHNVSLDPAKHKKLLSIVEQKKGEYETAAEAAENVRKKVDAVTKEMEEKIQVKAIDKKLKDVVKNIDKIKSEVNRLKVSLTTNERNISNCEQKVASYEEEIKNAETHIREMIDQRKEIEEDATTLLTCIEEIAAKIEEGTSEFTELKETLSGLTTTENKLKSLKIEWDQKINAVKEKMHEIDVQVKAFQAKISALKLQPIPEENAPQFRELSEEEYKNFDEEAVITELKAKEAELKNSKPNLSAIEEYRKKMDVFIVRAKELDEVAAKRKQMREYFDMLLARRKHEFLEGYNVIKMKLKEMYQMITIGGDADFELMDSFDPFNEGVQFRVRPPKKTWKIISNLSGGEKTLASLALVFALHYYKPSPLYVMDEIDAALDFKNVSIVGNYIKERTKDAQFIIISLRSNMFELSDYLIGIYKTFNCTKTAVIDPRKFDGERRHVPVQNHSELHNGEVNIDDDVFYQEENRDKSHEINGNHETSLVNHENGNGEGGMQEDREEDGQTNEEIDENNTNEKKTNENETNENKTNENKTNGNETNENKTNENRRNENETNENERDENETNENKTNENKTNGNETNENKTDEDSEASKMEASEVNESKRDKMEAEMNAEDAEMNSEDVEMNSNAEIISDSDNSPTTLKKSAEKSQGEEIESSSLHSSENEPHNNERQISTTFRTRQQSSDDLFSSESQQTAADIQDATIHSTTEDIGPLSQAYSMDVDIIPGTQESQLSQVYHGAKCD